MGEAYVGTKFRTVFARRAVSGDERLGELLKWCRRWAALGLVGDTIGNLSFRTVNGFLINRTAGDLGGITRQEFVEVIGADVDRAELTVVGLYEPSSESLMHAGIYAMRPGINAVFHGHNARLLAEAERLELPITAREQPYGTPELVAEILGVLDEHRFIIMRNHGFVSFGATMEEAGREAEGILKRI
ncbi:MAG TPA: class II aldolase/adducin family protein [Verrucomicrobiae bacterium]|nr:class II aldolase/adducin family protein [Verrucomicrobiae bacterium]